MACYFSAEQVAKLHQGHEDVHRQFAELRERYISRKYKSDRAREYALHGFGRRLGTLVRAIDQVYEILPPDREDIPGRDELVDATIAIQSFVLNAFGCLDNLAWIWVYEQGIKGKDGKEVAKRSDLAIARSAAHSPMNFALTSIAVRRGSRISRTSATPWHTESPFTSRHTSLRRQPWTSSTG
jgi:hypothetical protein